MMMFTQWERVQTKRRLQNMALENSLTHTTYTEPKGAHADAKAKLHILVYVAHLPIYSHPCILHCTYTIHPQYIWDKCKQYNTISRMLAVLILSTEKLLCFQKCLL